MTNFSHVDKNSDLSTSVIHRNLKFLHMTYFSPHISYVIYVTNMRYDYCVSYLPLSSIWIIWVMKLCLICPYPQIWIIWIMKLQKLRSFAQLHIIIPFPDLLSKLEIEPFRWNSSETFWPKIIIKRTKYISKSSRKFAYNKNPRILLLVRPSLHLLQPI